MPELPEVEIVTRGLKPVLEGKRVQRVELRRDGLRFKFPERFSARLEGRTIQSLARRAKYIVASLDDGNCLLIHLGMTGRFSILTPSGRTKVLGDFYYEDEAEASGATHDHVVLTLDDGTRVIYSDPRRFGVMDLFSHKEGHKLLDGLGVEPLGNEFNAQYLAAKFTQKAAPLKAALLDQKIVAGLGNIYVCEALYRARLSPSRKAGTLARGRKIDARLEALARDIREVLRDAIAYGGSTLRDFAGADGAAGNFQERFQVYGREGEPCRNCGAAIKRIVQSGRSTFFCKTCQK